MKLKKKFSDFNGFFFDCDGVLWQGSELLPGTKELLSILEKEKKKTCFLSNNSTKTIKQYIEKFQNFGIEVSKDQVVTSVQVTIHYLNQLNNIQKVFIIGESGLETSLNEAGYQIANLETVNAEIDAVIVGMDRYFTYAKLAKALQACLTGARFIATNPDPQFPTPDGFYPGAGSMIGALQSALNGVEPEIVCGKPNPLMAKIALSRFNLKGEEVIFIGDRVTTDLQCALDAGIHPMLVKSGFGSIELTQHPNFKYYKVIETLNDLIDL